MGETAALAREVRRADARIGHDPYGLGRTLPHLLLGRRGARRRFADDAAQLLARAGEG